MRSSSMPPGPRCACSPRTTAARRAGWWSPSTCRTGRCGLRPRLGRSRVQVTGSVPLNAVASVHIDEPEAQPAVVAAVEALPAADAGDDDALFALDEAQARDLLWYDVSEIPHLGAGS